MNKEQRRAIRKFETWQMKKFARNAKKGYYFFQPDNVSLPTPRSARDAWGGTYTPQAEDDRNKRSIQHGRCMRLCLRILRFLFGGNSHELSMR
jgi:hypothetical protein